MCLESTPSQLNLLPRVHELNAENQGRVVGKAFGGNAIVFIKPSVFVGGDRPGSWGLEVGYKVLGF